MAKDTRPAKAGAETPFQRFQRLARRLANVPKERFEPGERDKPKGKGG